LDEAAERVTLAVERRRLAARPDLDPRQHRRHGLAGDQLQEDAFLAAYKPRLLGEAAHQRRLADAGIPLVQEEVVVLQAGLEPSDDVVTADESWGCQRQNRHRSAL